MSVVCAGRRARDATLPVVVVAAPRVAVVRELRPFGLLECWCNGVSLGLGVIVRGRPSSDAGGKQPVGGDRFRGVLLVGAPDIVVSLQRLATTDTQHDKSVVRWPAHRALGRAFAALLGVEAAKHVFGTRSNFADTIAENAMLYSYCGLAAPDDGGGGVRQPAAALALCRALLEPLRLADAPLDEAAADAGGDVAVALPPPVSTARVEVSRETTVQALAAAVSRRAAVPGAFRALPFERKSLPHWQAAIVNAGLPMPKSRSGNVDLCCELGARQSLPIGGDAAETFDRLVGSHCTPAVRQQAALVSRAVAALYARLAVPAFGGASACARKRQSRDASPPPLAQHRSKRRAPAAPRIETRGERVRAWTSAC